VGLLLGDFLSPKLHHFGFLIATKEFDPDSVGKNILIVRSKQKLYTKACYSKTARPFKMAD
jgi:hypothetical protein